MRLDEIPERFTNRYWKFLISDTWKFPEYFRLFFEGHLGDYTDPIPTIAQAEEVVIASRSKLSP